MLSTAARALQAGGMDDDGLAARLGAQVRRLRWVHELSQQQLAAAAGVPQATVSRLESGVRLPGLRTLDQLVRPLRLELVVTLRPRPPEDRQELAWELEYGIWRHWIDHACRWAEVCPLVVTGGLGAAVQGLPITPDRVDIVTNGDPTALDRLLRLTARDELTPKPDDDEATHVVTNGRTDIRIRSTGFDPHDRVDVLAGGRTVPVLALHRIVAEDPWVAAVWTRQQGRG